MEMGHRGDRIVVVGGGQAAVQMTEAARQQGCTGSITLISEESALPYQRPPLSKQYLAGGRDLEWLLYRLPGFYTKLDIQVRLGKRVVSIDRPRKLVMLDDGTALEYDRLALATGTRARRLEVAGAASRRVHYIRTLADVDALRAVLSGVESVVIVGGGFIGLETAAVLVKLGLRVTLVATQDRLIPKVAGLAVSRFLLETHRGHGVDVRLNSSVVELRDHPNGKLEVLLADGSTVTADLAIAGIGAEPCTDLAAAAGLECDNGIVVDEYARTSDPDILAAGDCTNHPNQLLGRRLRLETVHNAVEQGRTAGHTLAGRELAYCQTPWVWSDQYHLRYQSVGVAFEPTQAVLRGDPGSGRFSVFSYRHDELLAVDCVNQPMVFGAMRRALNARVTIERHDAADPHFNLEALTPKDVRFQFDVPWPTKEQKRQRALAWGHE